MRDVPDLLLQFKLWHSNFSFPTRPKGQNILCKP
jgi:hypothetical protein